MFGGLKVKEKIKKTQYCNIVSSFLLSFHPYKVFYVHLVCYHIYITCMIYWVSYIYISPLSPLLPSSHTNKHTHNKKKQCVFLSISFHCFDWANFCKVLHVVIMHVIWVTLTSAIVEKKYNHLLPLMENPWDTWMVLRQSQKYTF